ncbi:MAG TPA: SGNH/GDSL hydrolase family protein [Bacteroidales bacterium]
MKRKIAGFCAIALIISISVYGQTEQKIASKVTISPADKTANSQWQGKRVAYLGDSMTQKPKNGNNTLYWEYLTDLLGITPYVYGISGNQWDGIYKQAVKLHNEKGTVVDAILIFAGTNDFSHGVPLGKFYTETTKETNHNGNKLTLSYRTFIENDSTFCGRINKVMAFLKANFPEQQIIIMTPIHRGYAKFSEKNVQPEENFANERGLYLDSYVDVLKQAASYWAVPLIDLYSISGLYPLTDSHAKYFNNTETDRLHPNAWGNYRLAKTIQYQLLTLPATFQIQQ